MGLPLPRKAHWPPIYLYVQAAAIAVTVWVMVHARYQDDGYISLIYARNLIAGNGLTWNPGEYVEGYSNFLYTLLIAGLGRLGIDLVQASIAISFAGYFGLVGALYAYTRWLHERTHAHSPHAYAHSINRALCVTLVASSAPVLAWCFGGLEEVFFTFLLLSAMLLVLRWLESGTRALTALLTGACFALAAMTRLEGAMIGGVSGLFLAALWLLRLSPHITFRKLALLGAGFALVFCPYMAWRISYFGEWLPNTYYAKLYQIDPGLLRQMGFGYLILFFITPPMLPLFCVVMAAVAARRKWLSPPLLYLIAAGVVLCAHVVRAGGDHMPYIRFLVPAVPLCALIIYYINNALIPHSEKWFRDICGALIALSVVQFITVKNDDFLSRGALSGIAVADHIKAHWKPGSLIAINPAGALPYFAPDYRYIDMLGLMDKHIARREIKSETVKKMIISRPVGHLKGDGDYVLKRRPDYIIFGDIWGDPKPRFLSDLEIAAHPDFEKLYMRVETYITPPERLLPELRRMEEKYQSDFAKHPDSPYLVEGPVLNRQNQLRFIYYQRRK